LRVPDHPFPPVWRRISAQLSLLVTPASLILVVNDHPAVVRIHATSTSVDQVSIRAGILIREGVDVKTLDTCLIREDIQDSPTVSRYHPDIINARREPHYAMLTPHEDEVFKQLLLSNRDDNVVLGPFDGNVGALLDDGIHFVTTPNQPIILAPPIGVRVLWRCKDGRYGMDDPTQWPQLYCPDAAHFACIPRRPATGENDIMWRDLTSTD
ncbi:hypothetical protein BDN72DRAFT_866419, partial [Pluteus cervinus]